MNVLAFVAGLVVVALTLLGVVYVLILPRPPSGVGRVSLAVIRSVHGALTLASRAARTYEGKDRLLAFVAPLALIAQLLSWAVGLSVGFALMLVPVTHSLGLGVEQAVTSLFTVGTIHVGGRANTAIDIMAGASWVVVVALQIAYLPSLYSKFAHREGLVTLLESRAGLPTWGPELLVRHHFVGVSDSIPTLYEEWEKWAAEVVESHTTYPVLLYFRSPDPWLSWVIGLLTVLDAAALHVSLMPKASPANCRMLLHTGFTSLQRLAASMGWDVDADARGDAQMTLTFDEFARAVDILSRFGPPLERTAEEAWTDFRGWRINYESAAYRLADYLTAPPAPWSGPRRGVRPENMVVHHAPHQLLDREAGTLTPGPHVRAEPD